MIIKRYLMLRVPRAFGKRVECRIMTEAERARADRKWITHSACTEERFTPSMLESRKQFGYVSRRNMP